MQRTGVIPIQQFRDLFVSWPDNESLTLKDLRMKCITLLALTAMLRPSDVAPQAQLFDPETFSVDRLAFSFRQVTFTPDGNLQIVFHGIKNDTDRKGFPVTISAGSCKKLDPVSCLLSYTNRTKIMRQAITDEPVFLSLTRPYRAIGSTTIASVLGYAIAAAGLGGQGYSAKSFRPTGATAAVNTGCDPKTAMQIGRWKTDSVFYTHYVHSTPAQDYTDRLLAS